MVLDNLGCVHILGGVVPAFARGGRPWGEFVSGGAPKPALQRLALSLHDMQEQGDFSLIPVWRPRDENVRADFLSRVSTLPTGCGPTCSGGWMRRGGRTPLTGSRQRTVANGFRARGRDVSAPCFSTRKRCGPTHCRSRGQARRTGPFLRSL